MFLLHQSVCVSLADMLVYTTSVHFIEHVCVMCVHMCICVQERSLAIRLHGSICVWFYWRTN